MKKHYINGKEKAFPDTTPSCNVCKDGNLFVEGPYKLHNTQPVIKEHICLECETKYKEARLTPALPVDILTAKDYYESEIKDVKIDNEMVTENNLPYFVLKISHDYGEAIKMNPKVMEMRTEYERTRLCPQHTWIESKPFKTAEGTFSIKNCAVCKEGSLLYKGEQKYGSLTQLIDFLVSKSMVYNIKALQSGEMFSDKILKGIDFKIDPKDITGAINVAKELEIHTKPKLSFDVKPKLQF